MVELAIPRLVPSVLNLEVPLVQLLRVQLVALLHPPQTINMAFFSQGRADIIKTMLTISEAHFCLTLRF